MSAGVRGGATRLGERCTVFMERDVTGWMHKGETVPHLVAGLAYSIEILSERSWKKSEPPATIQMTILDDGRLHVIGLSSTFVGCR